MNWIGQENVPFVNTPFLFYSRVGQQQQAAQCPPLGSARGKAAWTSAADFRPLFDSPGEIVKSLDFLP